MTPEMTVGAIAFHALVLGAFLVVVIVGMLLVFG